MSELCIDTPCLYDPVKLAQALGGAKGSYRLVSMLEVPANNGFFPEHRHDILQMSLAKGKVDIARGCTLQS